MPAQPFSAEAKIWLTNYVLDRSVIVKLLSRDRYDRVVQSESLSIFLLPPLLSH